MILYILIIVIIWYILILNIIYGISISKGYRYNSVDNIESCIYTMVILIMDI